MFRKLIGLSFLLVFVSMVSAEGKIEKIEKIKSYQKVLIAIEKSKFKDAVISNIDESLKKKEIVVDIIKLKELRKIEIDNYNVILLVNTCKMWKLNGKVKKFLKKLGEDDKKKIILFTTAGDPKWRTKEKNIDAITSASNVDLINDTSNDLLQRIENIMLLNEKTTIKKPTK